MRSLKLGLVVCLVLMSVTFVAKAQTLATATVTGTVQDPSGANVPGAQVTVRQVTPCLARTTQGNAFLDLRWLDQDKDDTTSQ